MSMFRMLSYAVMLFSASHALSQDYEIRLTRPDRVGAKFEIATISSQSTNTTVSYKDRILKKESSSLTVQLEGTVTVLEVGPSKHATRIRVLVTDCTVMRNDGKAYEGLPKGAQIVMQLANGKTEYLLNGYKAINDKMEILQLLFSLHTGKTSDDDIFGTKERKRVGDVWAMDSAKAAASLAGDLEVANAENMHGETTLEKIVDVGGVPCLRIRAKMEATGFVPPLPPEATVESSRMAAMFSGDYPIDVSLDIMHEEESIGGTIQARGRPDPQAPEVTLSITRELSRSMNIMPLK
jgi:hypothetical protein